jgi:hypothetical protein
VYADNVPCGTRITQVVGIPKPTDNVGGVVGSNVIDVNELQLMKTLLSIVVTLLGIVIDVNELHS